MNKKNALTRIEPVVIKVDDWRTREPSLAKFLLDHLPPKAIDELLDRIDTHGKYGKGEKSHV